MNGSDILKIEELKWMMMIGCLADLHLQGQNL
jgi:hypothetical protein